MRNFAEGARRIGVVEQIGAVVGAAIFVLFLSLPSYRDFIALLFSSLFMLVAPLVICLFVWALGWFLEGFSTVKVEKRNQ